MSERFKVVFIPSKVLYKCSVFYKVLRYDTCFTMDHTVLPATNPVP